MIFAENYAKIIQSPEVGGKIQVSGDSDLSPGLLSFSGNQFIIKRSNIEKLAKIKKTEHSAKKACARPVGVSLAFFA
ncbi:MAG: hypothetical protein ACYCYR_15055 [Desulfobulbaceae bacterium]